MAQPIREAAKEATRDAVAADMTPLDGVDLQEWYFAQGYTDGLPVVPPTEEKVEALLEALGGDPTFLEARAAALGQPTRRVLAINAVMAGCLPIYAPVSAPPCGDVRKSFQSQRHSGDDDAIAPLAIVNGPVREQIGMNAGHGAFGPGNRANATIGRAIRLILLNVGGGLPGVLDKSTQGTPAKYSYCVAENEEDSPWAPYHVEKGYRMQDSTVFVIGAESNDNINSPLPNDPEGILNDVISSMTTVVHNNARASGHCTVALSPEHAQAIAKHGWIRHDVRCYLQMYATNKFGRIVHDHKYGKAYNRHLPKWYRRDLDSDIPIVPSPDNIHLFVIGGTAGRFSSFIPGWGHYNNPVLRSIDGAMPERRAGLHRRHLLPLIRQRTLEIVMDHRPALRLRSA